jgi:DNA repair exonuclease SbcCD ATPase subunit
MSLKNERAEMADDYNRGMRAEIRQLRAEVERWKHHEGLAIERCKELETKIERLRTDNELLQADRNRWREMWGELDARAALEPCVFESRDDNGKVNPMSTSGRTWCRTHGFDCPNLVRAALENKP